MTTDNVQTASLIDRLGRFAPGLPALLRYRKQDLPHDLVAGLSVAAVALPVGVAYAQLAGFSPVVGLYSSILPLAAYALFGTSRQLIVGPDAATCALVAAAVAPLAAGDENLYLSLSMAPWHFSPESSASAPASCAWGRSLTFCPAPSWSAFSTESLCTSS
jgi:hypothetical protein